MAVPGKLPHKRIEPGIAPLHSFRLKPNLLNYFGKWRKINKMVLLINLFEVTKNI